MGSVWVQVGLDSLRAPFPIGSQQQFPAWQKGIQDAGFPETPAASQVRGTRPGESRDPRQRLGSQGVASADEGSQAEGKQTQTIKAHPPWLSPHPHHYRMKSRAASQRALRIKPQF